MNHQTEKHMENVQKIENIWIERAKQILADNDVVAEFSGMSEAHGISVYFKSESGEKIRVSTHSVSSHDRIANERLFYFKLPTMPRPQTNH